MSYKKFIAGLIMLFFCANSVLAENPVFQDKDRLIMLHGAASIKNGEREILEDDGAIELGYVAISYSRPAKLFTLDSRQNIEIGGMIGKSDVVYKNQTIDYSKYNQLVLGVSQDLIFGWKSIYLTAGVGAHIKSKSTKRIGSKLTFSQRVGLGTSIGNYNIETYYRHFSNGGITDDNAGHDFIGLSFGYKF